MEKRLKNIQTFEQKTSELDTILSSMDNLSEILDKERKRRLIERCGEDPDKQGIVCPYCGAHEVYAPKDDKQNCDKWFWVIKAFRVDNHSHCLNCDKWFK